MRIQDSLADQTIKDENIIPYAIPKVPPWKLFLPEIKFDLARFNKDSTPSQAYIHKFHELTDHFQTDEILFTDGSKTPTGVAFAVVWDQTEFVASIDKRASIYTAELHAILKAVELVTHEYRSKRAAICSDSLSSLKTLTSRFANDPMVTKIQIAIHDLIVKGINITLVWVPGHVGIRGNEKADMLAKSGLLLPPAALPIRLEDKILAVKVLTYQESIAKQGSNIIGVPPIVRAIAPLSDLTRREKTALLRAAIGHTRLTHSYLLTRTDPPRCPSCSYPERLTIQHIFNDCPAHVQTRTRLGLSTDLQTTLKQKNYTIMSEFLTSINIVHDL